MATFILHRNIRIVTLDQGEQIVGIAKPDDIVLIQQADGWWVNFVDENGNIDGYDAPFEHYNKALWTAKAAAEFQSE